MTSRADRREARRHRRKQPATVELQLWTVTASIVGAVLVLAVVSAGFTKSLDRQGDQIEALQEFVATFASQNRAHRVDNHAENGCLLQLTLEDLERRGYQVENSPRLEADLCGQLVVTAEPPDLPPATTTTTTTGRRRATTAPARRPTTTTRPASPAAPTTTRPPATPNPTTTTTTCTVDDPTNGCVIP